MIMRTGIGRLKSTSGALLLGLTGLLATGCDKVPLTAPSESTVTVTTSSNVLPPGGTAAVSAFVAEQSGTPVQNGTVVRFATNLGRVDPVEAQTRNGIATTTFLAGDASGLADIRATSGSIGGSGETATNVVRITVGAAAAETVTVRANPGSVPATGGTVELAASVVSVNGTALSGIPVSFTTTEGTLAASRVVTDAAGEAKTSLSVTLSTGGTAVVTALAGTKSGTVTIGRQTPAPRPTVTLAAVAGTATIEAQRFEFTATVAGTNDTTLPTEFEWDFGDGQTATTNGPSIGHVYTTNGVKTVTVTVSLTNGQEISANTQIIVALAVPAP
jgi:hypothetical protein